MRSNLVRIADRIYGKPYEGPTPLERRPAEEWIRAFAEDALSEGWSLDPDDHEVITYTPYDGSPGWQIVVYYQDVCNEIERLKKQLVEDHTGMIQNPMTGEWRWF